MNTTRKNSAVKKIEGTDEIEHIEITSRRSVKLLVALCMSIATFLLSRIERNFKYSVMKS